MDHNKRTCPYRRALIRFAGLVACYLDAVEANQVSPDQLIKALSDAHEQAVKDAE